MGKLLPFGQVNLDNVSTLNPDEMTSGGMPDNLDVTIVEARFVPVKYGTMTNYAIGLRVKYVADDDSVKPFQEQYSGGDLKLFVPSADGIEPAGASAQDYMALASGQAQVDDVEDLAGVVALALNAKPGQSISSKSNVGYFMDSVKKCGFPVDELSRDVRFLEGRRFHMERQIKPKDKAEDKDVKCFVPTEYLGKVEGKKATAPAASTVKAATKAAPAQATAAVKPNGAANGAANGNGDLNEKVYGLILDQLRAAEEDGDTGLKTLAKSAVSKAVIGGLVSKEKTQAVTLLGNAAFHEAGEGYTYDADREVYELVE